VVTKTDIALALIPLAIGVGIAYVIARGAQAVTARP
jgi:hypothetical protein